MGPKMQLGQIANDDAARKVIVIFVHAECSNRVATLVQSIRQIHFCNLMHRLVEKKITFKGNRSGIAKKDNKQFISRYSRKKMLLPATVPVPVQSISNL